MATLTRSSRRAEGLHPHTANANARLIATSTRTAGTQNIFQNVAPSRTKRPIEVSDCEYEAVRARKTRITVEIISRSTIPIPTPTAATVSVGPSPQPQQQRPAAAAPKPRPAPAKIQSTTSIATKPAEPTKPNPQSSLTKHQKKVINGIRHELDRLQPSADDTKHEGRKLRSQEGTRFKSELSAYFPEYDEVIGNEPKENHILNLDTPIIVVDSNTLTPKSHTKVPLPPTVPGANGALGPHQRNDSGGAYPVRRYSDELFKSLCDSQRIDFSFLETRYKGKTLEDPLPDGYFEPAHKKAERLEKSIRNSEKGRAQHEKDQIIRLLEGLEGHDWLRTMGVSGITEGKKKSFEPARRHFIKGCQAILEKFRLWNLEEKRRKQERDRAASQASVDGEEPDEDNAVEADEVANQDEDGDLEIPDSEAENSAVADAAEEQPAEDIDKGSSDSDPPDLSDVDASIEKQLQEEALARSRIAASTKTPSRNTRGLRATAKSKTPPRQASEPQEEFKSFFRKKHERQAALNRNKRTGRKVLAWGHPIPEIPEVDFNLPQQYRDTDTMKTRERSDRSKRRDTRRTRRS